MIMKKATLENIDNLTQIAVESRYRWNDNEKDLKKHIISSLKRKGAETYYLLKNNIAVGYIVITIKNKIADIDFMGIKKKYQGKGYGKEIMFAIISQIKKSYNQARLAVWARNFTAISLYNKFGFYVYKIQRNNYPNGDAKLFMKKELK
ncbi:GNAT family N-acetyltransferase [Candidatus Pacearchaeota archaeon]|nr:GNAT family N-acetyltransferase [Candidatus Pacearchaeota archaeon]